MNIYIIGDHDPSKIKLGSILAKRMKYNHVTKEDASLFSFNNIVFDGYIHPKNFTAWFNPKKDAVLVLVDTENCTDYALKTIECYIDFLIDKKEMQQNRYSRRSYLKIDPWSEKDLEVLVDLFLMKFKRSVCALIQDNKTGLYLGVSRKNDPNDFGLPGGKVDPGETDEEAIIRELKEETGLDFQNLKPVFNDFAKNNKVYYCTTFSGNWSGKIYTEEKGVVKWVTKQDLFNGSFGEYNKKLFNKLGL